MGLFDFVSTVGKKLGIEYFEQEEKAKRIEEESARRMAESGLRLKLRTDIRAKIESLGLGLENFSVTLEGRTAELHGTAKTQADKEKAIMCAGNFAGIDKVDDTALVVAVAAPKLETETPAEPPVAEPPGAFHEVRKGETLSLIAKAYYGIIMAYPQIADANQPLIENADRITPGWIVRIPPITAIRYTTKKGDTLGAIAKTMYGDARKYTVIFEANKGLLTNPDVLKPELTLIIPALHPLPAGRPEIG